MHCPKIESSFIWPDWYVCMVIQAYSKIREHFDGSGLQIMQQHSPLPVAGLQCIRDDFCEGLESTVAARSEGPAAASSLDRSWLSAETSLRLFPAQLQSLLQLRYERPADTPLVSGCFLHSSDLPAPLPEHLHVSSSYSLKGKTPMPLVCGMCIA